MQYYHFWCHFHGWKPLQSYFFWWCCIYINFNDLVDNFINAFVSLHSVQIFRNSFSTIHSFNKIISYMTFSIFQLHILQKYKIYSDKHTSNMSLVNWLGVVLRLLARVHDKLWSTLFSWWQFKSLSCLLCFLTIIIF